MLAILQTIVNLRFDAVLAPFARLSQQKFYKERAEQHCYCAKFSACVDVEYDDMST